MNKKFILVLLLCTGVYLAYASSDEPSCMSHFFVPRGASTDLTWIDALSFYNRTRQYPEKKYIYNGTMIYQQSTKNSTFGSGFLLGDGNNFITVVQGGGSGINSIELGLANSAPFAPFSSRLTIQPTRKQFTYIGNMYFNFESWWCGLWGDITFGVTNAHHRLNCCELGNKSSICPGIQTIADALSASTLESSKFYCDACRDGKRRTGLEDIQLRLGYDYKWCSDNRIGIYLIGTIPAGRSPTAEFIFEPLVGSKHGSIGIGFLGDYQFTFCGCDDTSLTLLTDFNYRYAWKHKECRTFDLMPNGPMSRYILVVDQSALGLPFPAANVSTLKVNATPSSTIQWWVGLNYEYCDWDFEIGYNLFWRQKERLELIDDTCFKFPTTVGIYNVNSCGLSNVTASQATMINPGIPDVTFVPLTISNLDLASATAGRLLTNKVYAALSWTGCACDCFEWMAGFGGSYEFVVKHDRCAAPQSWAVFSKLAIGF